MQEESGEILFKDSNGEAVWLCPLCQQGQEDRSSLSLHLTEQHNVLSACVDKLLDIAILKQCANGREENRGAKQSTDTSLLLHLKASEDSTSQPSQSEENLDAAQQPGDKVMEEERAAEQEGGAAQPEWEQEGTQPAGEKTLNVTASDLNDKKSDKKPVGSESNTRSFKCNACLETFHTKTALCVHYNSASHIQRMTMGSAKQLGENEPQTPAVPVLSRPYISNKPYQCAVCRVSYNHAITLESHMKSVLHQTRSRSAGNAANSAAAAAGASGASSNSAPNTAAGPGAAQVAAATTNCPSSAVPGNVIVTAKSGEQIQVSAAVPSLLSSPVASAQAVSAFLTLLTSGQSSLSHSLFPSLFTPSAAPGAPPAVPGAPAPQLVSQPHMLMPLILNGLQAQTQQQPENQSGQLLTQCVPLLGLSAAQQALVTQRLSTLQSQWPSVGIKPATQPCQDELKQGVKCEEDKVKQEGYKTGDKVPVKTEDGDSWTLESLEMGGEGKESAQSMKSESKLVKTEKDGDNGRAHGENGADGDCSTDQLALEEDEKASLNLSLTATEKVFRNNNPSPSASIPSSSSLSPVNLNLTLSPDSTPQKSQPGTSPCSSLGSPKASPYKTALMSPDQTRSASNMRGWYTPPGPPVLSEFQSEVLWAFFESRSEADAASPPRDDCEALGREVGLSEEEVRMWLSQVRQAKERQRATGTEPRTRGPEGEARYPGSSDNDYYDEEESALVIAEGEDSADTSGSQAIDLSNRRGKRRKRELGREGHGDSCLTSDSENEEVYTSVIVSEEESQNGSTRGGPVSPRKDEMLEVASDRVLGGGKVLRSTTVFLSDAEDEYEEEENAAGRRGSSKKRQMAFEHDELEIKKGRLDPDVDLELEAQGDPPSAQPHSLDHSDLRSGLVHSLPLSLSLTPFSAQFLSPYVLSVPSTMAAEAGKVQAFPNPPNITRFSDAILTQTLSSLGQASHCLSNGGDCESALDLSMGKNGNSKSSSSSVVADKTSAQKGRLLDGLGLRPTSKGLVVVKVKPDSVAATTSPNSSSSLINCNKVSKSSIYMRAAEKMNATLLEREREKERQKERDGEQQQQRPKGKRYRDMRRSRTIIQAEQLDILYGCYFKDPNPGKHEFEQISEWVHLPKKVVQIWFQNMRARERKGEVRFISDGTLAAVGKPLIKFTWPLSKPIFSHKPIANNTGCITTAPIVRTLIKNDKDLAMEVSKAILVKKQTPVPIKPKEVVSSTAASHVSSSASVVPKTKLETTSNVTIVQVAPKANAPVVLAAPKEPIAIAPRPPLKRKPQGESEEEKTDEEMDNENETGSGPGTTNRMVPKLPTTPINNKHPATVVASQKQNGLNYWTPKGPYKINTLSREQLALPTPPRTIPPPPTPSIAPVSPNTPSSGKAASPATPALAKSSPTESSFMTHSSSRRPRTHLSCLQLSILQSCYETCAHPNAMECEAIGTELGLPLKVVQIWFQNTRAKEKRWRLQQEKMSLPSAGKMDTSSGSYLQYNALRANRPILPKPVQLTVIEPAASPVTGQPAPKETLMGRCEACSTCFESRAAARAHVFSPRHLATLRTTNFGQPTTLVNKNGTGSSGSVGGSQAAQSGSGRASGAEAAVESPPPKAGSAS